VRWIVNLVQQAAGAPLLVPEHTRRSLPEYSGFWKLGSRIVCQSARREQLQTPDEEATLAPDEERGRSRSPLSLYVLSGGAKGDRTPDLMTASHALSQLSYGPTLLVAISNGENASPALTISLIHPDNRKPGTIRQAQPQGGAEDNRHPGQRQAAPPLAMGARNPAFHGGTT
jgi:hypothetical protein